MKLTAREVDEMEDERVFSLSRRQGWYGVETAKQYSQLLTQRSTAALTAGYIDDALWYAEREFEFISRFFGLSHAYSKLSLMCLELLKEHKVTISQEQEIESSYAA